MFDARTAALLQSAPSLKQLNAEELPKLLTQKYAELVAARLRGSDVPKSNRKQMWSLGGIADAYEIIASIESNSELRRAAAFVAGTAQQIIARGNANEYQRPGRPVITRDSVDNDLTAALLFLIAEQYADANEAAKGIIAHTAIEEFRVLASHIKDLARGHLKKFSIVHLVDVQMRHRPHQERALYVS